MLNIFLLRVVADLKKLVCGYRGLEKMKCKNRQVNFRSLKRQRSEVTITVLPEQSYRVTVESHFQQNYQNSALNFSQIFGELVLGCTDFARNMRFAALFMLYEMCALLHHSKLNNLAKNWFENAAIFMIFRSILQILQNFKSANSILPNFEISVG